MPQTFRRIGAATIVLCLASSLAACGGDDKAATTTASSPVQATSNPAADSAPKLAADLPKGADGLTKLSDIMNSPTPIIVYDMGVDGISKQKSAEVRSLAYFQSGKLHILDFSDHPTLGELARLSDAEIIKRGPGMGMDKKPHKPRTVRYAQETDGSGNSVQRSVLDSQYEEGSDWSDDLAFTSQEGITTIYQSKYVVLLDREEGRHATYLLRTNDDLSQLVHSAVGADGAVLDD